MSKALICAIVAGALVLVLIVAGGIVGLVLFMEHAPEFTRSARYSHVQQQPIHVALPRTAPRNSIAVLNFRSSGDSDSKFLAVGFARALADRLYCAPRCLTTQCTVAAMSGVLAGKGMDLRRTLTDAQARGFGRSLGVRYVITGDLQSSSGRVDLGVVIQDTSRKSAGTKISVSGAMADTPAMQAEIAGKIARAIGLKPTAAQQAELGKPNFANPAVLTLYGNCFASEDYRQAIAKRWQMVEADPGSLFPILRLLESYAFGQTTALELQRDKRLASALADARKRFAGNSHVAVLHGMLLGRQYDYQAAEAALKRLARNDPRMPRVHGALAYVARCRQNGDLAVAEGKKLVALWPTNADAHASLAGDYKQAASNARQGHYYSNMTRDMESEWRSNSETSYREALIATKLDRNCWFGWSTMLSVSRELGRSDDVETAYREMVRINPRNCSAYTDYAFCFSPQWGGTSYQRERIIADAERAFGKGSVDVKMIRAQVLLGNVPSREGRVGGRYSQEILRLANEVSRECKGPNESAMLLQCRAYMVNRRRAELLEVAKKGFETWGSPEWRYLLGMGYSFRYEDKSDRDALNKAYEMFSTYAKQIPFDPRGHVQWGWCLSHQGKRAEAKARFLKALELDPTNESAKQKLEYVK